MESTAFLTDMYEYSMLNDALSDGSAFRKCVFEVYTRSLGPGRRYGVFAGLGRLLSALKDMKPTGKELEFLLSQKIISEKTAKWLEGFRFTGTLRSFLEGDIYFPLSPVMQVESSYAEGLLLETLSLSILNYDSAVASAACRMSHVNPKRPCYEMGSRRMNEWAAVAAARAAIVGGFEGTSNMEAGLLYGIPLIGTSAHSFTLVHDSEKQAFEAQFKNNKDSTVLVDTFDVKKAIASAVKIAGGDLKGVRIDSGDLGSLAREVRAELDALGASSTKITVTGDLDEYALLSLNSAPVDACGIGTRLVTGSGIPTSQMVYKLVEREDKNGKMQPVSKKSAGKSTYPYAKSVYRSMKDGKYLEEIVVMGSSECKEKWEKSHMEKDNLVPMLHIVAKEGKPKEELCGKEGLLRARGRCKEEIKKFPAQILSLSPGEPVIETQMLRAR
ncbi:MAG: nicotinate phosphoribosyltransferase [Aeriscardovia sp.]|nr:nicotinate phosphoribosyltransferase [Aeriscardovia sp.]